MESLERKASENRERSLSPQEPPIEKLRRYNYELEILNNHVKNENEILREQVKLKGSINSTLSQKMEGLYKANKKLKKRNKKLNRALINLKFKTLIRKPKMALTTRRSKKIRLYVLTELSVQIE